METKNIIITLIGITLVLTLGFVLYNSHKQQEKYLKTIKSLQYSMQKGDGKGKKDPYKEIAVNNSLRKKVRDVQKCYNAFLTTKPTTTDGFVEIDWIILAGGDVQKAELISSNLKNDALNTCILNIIKKIEFPPPPTGSETYMTYKYNFKKTEEKKQP